MSWAAACVGGVGWSLGEYLIHRFIGHGPLKKAPASVLLRLTPSGFVAAFNAEHVAHHADPRYFAPSSHKAIAAAVVVPFLGVTLAPLVGLRRACSFGAGFAAAYLGYEVIHRRIHTVAPRGAYGRWLRQNHLLHHHRAPRANHGVTSPLWDHVFGTHEPTARVRVPRHVAPAWLVDAATGEAHVRFEHDYVLGGSRASAEKSSLRCPAAPETEPKDSAGASAAA